MRPQRMSIYANLGVREVWRLKRDALVFFGLTPDGNAYAPIAASAVLNGLTAIEMEGFLKRIGTVSRLA